MPGWAHGPTVLCRGSCRLSRSGPRSDVVQSPRLQIGVVGGVRWLVHLLWRETYVVVEGALQDGFAPLGARERGGSY